MTTPRTVEEITPSWLTYALSQNYPGTTVTGVAIEDIMPGMSMKIRVRPTYGAGSPALPETLIVKGHLAAHDLGNSFSYEIEMRSYAEIAPLAGLNTPKCYFTGIGAGGPVIILEDLKPKGVRFLDATGSLSFEQAKAFLEAMAGMHAKWWHSPELDEGRVAPWLSEDSPIRGGLDAYMRDNTSPKTWGQMAALPRGLALPNALKDQPRIAKAMERFFAYRKSIPPTLVHGDEHLGNFYLEQDGRPGFLDWQVRKEPWCVSFAYFTVLALDVLDRRAWEKDLLDTYLAALRGHGVAPPNFADAWRSYRECVIMPLTVWFTNRPTWQLEEICTSCATRAAWAGWDLEIFDL